MEHHEAYDSSPRRPQANSGSYPAMIPESPPPSAAAFRSVKISAPATTLLEAPLLHPNLNKLQTAAKSTSQDDSLPLAMAKKIEAVGDIPVQPSFHIPERTAIQIPEDIVSVGTLLDRILQYLRVHSISYECEPDTGCFDCMSPSRIGFAIQLWRGRLDNTAGKQLWVEVQRREGCAIGMNAIRRSILRHVKGGEPEPPAAATAGRRRPFSDSTAHSGSNKRRRSLSPHAGARLSCQDALVISVKLMESSRTDQQKLGLESLTVLTNSRLVNPNDAAVASRALILGEGPAGPRMQERFAALLRELQPAMAAGQDSYLASIAVTLYHYALNALANALEQVAHNNMAARMDLTSAFWQTAVACLCYSLDDATRRPHEATLAAKCIRYLLPVRAAAERLHAQPLQTALRRTHELGRAYNLSLEEESQKTLRFL